MRSALRCCWLHLLMLASPAQAQLDEAAERARIAQERSAADQSLREQEKACAARFAVTVCVEAARKAHREFVAPLRQQEFLLDDAQRQQRAAERRAVLQKKAAQTKSDIVLPGSQTPAVDNPEPTPRKPQPSPRKAPSAQEQAQLDQQRIQKQVVAQAKAAERAKSQQQKLEVAQRRKAEVERRNAENMASGKPTPAALKVPPATAANPVTENPSRY